MHSCAWMHLAPGQIHSAPVRLHIAPAQILRLHRYMLRLLRCILHPDRSYLLPDRCVHVHSLPSFLYCIFLLPCPLLCQSETSVLFRHLSRAVCACVHSSFVTQLHHHYCTISSLYVSFVNA